MCGLIIDAEICVLLKTQTAGQTDKDAVNKEPIMFARRHVRDRLFLALSVR